MGSGLGIGLKMGSGLVRFWRTGGESVCSTVSESVPGGIRTHTISVNKIEGTACQPLDDYLVLKTYLTQIASRLSRPYSHGVPFLDSSSRGGEGAGR